MEATVARGLLVLVVVAIILHCEHLSDLRRIAEVDRHIKALMDATMTGAAPSGYGETHTDMTNPSRPPENGPENAISEGVQRGRGNH